MTSRCFETIGHNKGKRDGKSSLRGDRLQKVLRERGNRGKYASGESTENLEGSAMESADGLEPGPV